METWRAIPGYEGYYEVSDHGAVRRVARKIRFESKRGNEAWRSAAARPVRAQEINSGYLVVHLNRDGKRSPRTVHSLVASAFFGPRPPGYDVAHWNGVKKDNRAENLRYATRTSNHSDKRRHGTHAWGEKIKGAKLKLAQVREIRRLRGTRSAVFLAGVYGVRPGTIYRVWSGETWANG